MPEDAVIGFQENSQSFLQNRMKISTVIFNYAKLSLKAMPNYFFTLNTKY